MRHVLTRTHLPRRAHAQTAMDSVEVFADLDHPYVKLDLDA